MKNVHVNVTDKNAIYIDDIRITDRMTKWGVHTTIEEFVCPRESVVSELLKKGYKKHVRLITDGDDFKAQREALNKQGAE